MKNLSIITFILLSLFTIHTLSGQNEISGKVTYKQGYKKSSNKKNKNQSFTDFENMIEKQVSKLSFTLEFNRTQYSFEHDKKMEVEDNRGLRLALSLGNGKGKYFGDIEKNIRLLQKHSLGSDFIIKSSFKALKWELYDEEKIIGKYNCKKATLLQDIHTSKGKKKKLITAWYTTEIPLPFGPAGYGNLPGLIIKLHVGSKYTFQAEKIKLSKSKLKITPPSKGKVISESDFDSLSKKAYEARKKRVK
ncbi:GLPGLI family protein [Tenacibaculum ascidiaceicola]|uniref:GLPGLI family protein n=1 Tax=Tenacibaculum ascidiaceicola TaxID=1699411 RepID=UPI003CE5AF21